MTVLADAARMALEAVGTDTADATYAAFGGAVACDVARRLSDEALTDLFTLSAALLAVSPRASIVGLVAALPHRAGWDTAVTIAVLDACLRRHMAAVARGAPPTLKLIPGGIVDG